MSQDCNSGLDGLDEIEHEDSQQDFGSLPSSPSMSQVPSRDPLDDFDDAFAGQVEKDGRGAVIRSASDPAPLIRKFKNFVPVWGIRCM